jgi:hypothetical protein
LRRRAVSRFALVLCAATLAAAVAGCKNSAQLFQDTGEGRWFSKPVDFFHKPDWATASTVDKSPPLTPSRPVAPEDMVSVDGNCAAPHAANAPAVEPPPPPDRPVGSIAGDLARAPMSAAMPADPQFSANQLLGGVALGMTECEVVRRAGRPGNVNIGAGDRGGRKVVLTYLTGPWPGIYTFDSGRLKVVDRAPEPPAPAAELPKTKKSKKAKKPVKPKTATREIERAYVQ